MHYNILRIIGLFIAFVSETNLRLMGFYGIGKHSSFYFPLGLSFGYLAINNLHSNSPSLASLKPLFITFLHSNRELKYRSGSIRRASSLEKPDHGFLGL